MDRQSFIIWAWIGFILNFAILYSQSASNNSNTDIHGDQKISLFLDCDECKLDFVLSEVFFINNVRDPKQAQIYILVVEQNTASKGKRYDLSFKGNKEFEGRDFNVFFTITQSETEYELQSKFVKMILLGLMNYIIGDKIIEDFDINYLISRNENSQIKFADSWNSWVFNLKLGGGLEAEESNISIDFKSAFSAEKITEKWKILNSYVYEAESEKFIDEANSIYKKLNSNEFESKVIFSLSENWSAGLTGQINSSSYRNINVSHGLTSAIEYNFLPWAISSKKYITLGYYAGIINYRYNQKTIFNKTSEKLFNHSAILALRFIDEWGSFEGKLKYSQYPKLNSKYKVQLESDLSFRVFEGFSISLELDAESIHDQIYLASDGATLEELLLKKQQLETMYVVELSLGLKYTFGSIYNNIVNDRL